jgi:hypothetical protein
MELLSRHRRPGPRERLQRCACSLGCALIAMSVTPRSVCATSAAMAAPRTSHAAQCASRVGAEFLKPAKIVKISTASNA